MALVAADDSGDEHRHAGTDGAAQKGNNFQIVSDRRATALDLEAFEWNATMDLLACLTAPPDSTLSVYRLLSEDQSPKLLSEKITGIGTSLAWSPCGRRIAVGDRLGGVSVYDGESGAVLHTKRLHRYAVVALSWTSASAGALDQATHTMPTQDLPPLLSVPSAPSNMFVETAEAAAEPNGSEGFTMLVSIDEGGIVMVSSKGTFPLQAVQLFTGEGPVTRTEVSSPGSPAASLQIDGLLEGPPKRCVAASLSPDLRQLAVLMSAQGAQESVAATPLRGAAQAGSPGVSHPAVSSTSPPRQVCAASTDAGPFTVAMLDVRTLAVRRMELAHVAGVAEQLVTVMQYVRTGVDTLGSVWRGATQNFAAKMRGLTEAVQASVEGSDGTPSVHMDLLELLCMGNPSKGIQDFVNGQTSPQQLMRLSRSLEQAFEYVNVTACTRLQVAGMHILTLAADLLGHAEAEKFKAFGMPVDDLRQVAEQTKAFLVMIEELLSKCGKARLFVRVLCQVLVQTAQRMAENPPTQGTDLGSAQSAPEDLNAFLDRMKNQQCLDLADISERIGATKSSRAQATAASPPGTSGSTADLAAGRMSLDVAAQLLLSKGRQVGNSLLLALTSRVRLLGCVPVNVGSPWTMVSSHELRKAAMAEAGKAFPSVRSLSSPKIVLRWEAFPQSSGCRLLVLCTSSTSKEAELQMLRIRVPPAPASKPPEPAVSRIRLSAAMVTGSTSMKSSHFMLGELYDASTIAALALCESADGGAVPIVCLLDIADVDFHGEARLSESMDVDTHPSHEVPLTLLPSEAIKRRTLDDSYIWASAMRVMCSRGVCSIYAWRARRMLTLDMEAEDEDEPADA
mmetsp:Transcript_17596/g.40697  ORF Transcript_17596/g.40697 Transcript_17596/m.40697 type:complete len:849 (-) Transcript_17596:27-2573(-)